MKLFILGYGRHGKDIVGELIRDRFGLSFVSSSWFVAERVCRPYMEAVCGVAYPSLQACFDDRHNHRVEWYEAIKQFNANDLSRLSREIFAEHDMYVGIRDRDEFLAAKSLADLAIWVDASDRKGLTDPTMKILRSDADIIIDNNQYEPTLDPEHPLFNPTAPTILSGKVERLMKALGK